MIFTELPGLLNVDCILPQSQLGIMKSPWKVLVYIIPSLKLNIAPKKLSNPNSGAKRFKIFGKSFGVGFGQCEEIYCFNLPSTQDAIVANEGLGWGSLIEMSCHPGFPLFFFPTILHIGVFSMFSWCLDINKRSVCFIMFFFVSPWRGKNIRSVF